MKKQVLVIHGGDTFKTYDEYLDFLNSYEINFEKLKVKGWKDNLRNDLGDEFEVVQPKMPNDYNAKYQEWKIWLEKLIPYLQDNLILVGHSLGGIFIAKYLSENDFPRTIQATFLIAPPYDDRDSEYSLCDFNLTNNLERLSEQGGRIYLYQSSDDTIVPPIDAEKYKKDLPSATARVFDNRGHFDQPIIPELIDDIKNLH